MSEIRFKRLRPDAVIPTRGSKDAAGLDLYYCGEEPLTVLSGRVLKVPTGVAVELPRGTYGRVAPRSSLAAKYGIDVLAGVIDSDYRGELVVILTTLFEPGQEHVVLPGDRVAQLIVESCLMLDPVEVEEFSQTERGSGGFGSTGI